MSTLLLRLAGPMQSWGKNSKLDNRFTQMEPTKSGVIGMVACALGIRREDSLAEFKEIKFGVRIDQTGELGSDFQTVCRQISAKKASMWITHRQYIFDAVFLVGIEGPDDFLQKIEHALHYPAFPMFLGRRSCPPAGRLSLGIRTSNLQEVLKEEAWQASDNYRKRMEKQDALSVEIVREVDRDKPADYSVRDEPISFSHKQRKYGFRNIIREKILIETICKDYNKKNINNNMSTMHNPMELLEDNDVFVKSKD